MPFPLILVACILFFVLPVTAEETKQPETTLLIKVVPRGAEVLVNGTSMGKAPFLIKNPTPGQINIHARSMGFRSLTRNFEVIANQNNVAVLILSSRSNNHDKVPGTLIIETDPQGANLLLNGQTLGKSPMRNENTPEGEYQLTVQFPGLGEKNLPVQVIGGEAVTATVLWNEPKPKSFLLDLTPKEAKVHFLNYPKTYQPSMPLPKGRYLLRASLPGYVTTDIAVEMGDKDFHSWVTLQKTASED